MLKNPNFTNMLILLFLTMSIFSISYNSEEVYGIEYTESEWGIKLKIQDPWKLSSNSNNYNNLCASNNEFKCLIVLNNALLDKINSITILAEKGQDFKNKCKCNSLLEFVQYDYTRSYGSLKNFFLIGDNQTVLNGNVSAWQMEYNIINKNNIMNHLITWTMVDNIFYKISYHAEEDIYSKYLPSVKDFINTIEFVIPKNDSKLLSKDNLPSFMTINNTKEEKKKEPSFMIPKDNEEEKKKESLNQLETTDQQQSFSYDNAWSGLKIDYPSNWSYLESYSVWEPDNYIKFFPQNDYNKTINKIYMQYYESEDGLGGNFPQNPKLEDIVKFVDNPTNNFTLNTSKIINHENITITNSDNKQVKTVKETILNDDLNRKSIRFITVEDVHPIIIVFAAPLNEFDKYQLIFNKMINSMELH